MISIIKNQKHLRVIRVINKYKFSTTAFRTSSSDDEYEFIQKSKVPTMHFQPSLLRLSIPSLEDSCRRYLKAQEPLLTYEEHEKTSEIVGEFLKNDGPRLQKELKDLDLQNKHTSYISEPWFDMYLKDRKPLPINYNPLLVFNQETDVAYNKPLIKSTNLIISAARFMKSLRAGLLEPEVFHLNPSKSDTKSFRTFVRLLPSKISCYGAYFFEAYPLDMSQYSSLFGTARIPQIGKDVLTRHPTSNHIVLMYRGYFYTMDLLDSHGNIRKPQEIASGLRAIFSDARGQNPCPVGALTTRNRDDWAKIRGHLAQLGNEKVLGIIDSAAFVFILDEEFVENDKNKLIRLFLHSDGTNRWFDKSLSLIISGDGVAGINFEHSWGDGVAVLRFLKELKKDTTEKPRFHPGDEINVLNDESSVEKLNFIVDDYIRESVEKSLQNYKTWTEDLSVDHLIVDGFGKEECKKFGVSPDAVMQLALQLAVFKRDRRAVATYESCSTAAFRHGRTETLRSCTTATKAFCEALSGIQGIVSNERLRKMMVECGNTHNILLKEAATGQGFDRHFFALKNLHEKSQAGNIPGIFQDPAYTKINQIVLSTSTLSSPEIMAGGFGPVIERGYGIGYIILDHKIGSVVTSYRQHRDASEYIGYLKSSIDDIRRILGNK